MPKFEKDPRDVAREPVLVRGNHPDEPGRIDTEVNFFVPMLERLGCTTARSCEGHPAGFYVVFHGPEHAARTIASTGRFEVQLRKSACRIGRVTQFGLRIRRAAGWTVRERNELFRQSAEE